MKKIVIHIGTEKTGTTSIQDALTIENEKSNRKNWFYPDSFLSLIHI